MENEKPKPPELPQQVPKKMSKRKTVIIIIAIVVIAIILVISLFEFVYLPFFRSLRQLSEKNLVLMETQYNPTLNFTIVKFANIGGKTLYNITVVSEFGEINQFPLEVKPGQWFQVGLKGRFSKATVQYATEPNGMIKEENFEWKW